MGGAEGGPAAVKGILKPGTLHTVPPSAVGDADDDARRDAKGKAPLVHSRPSSHTFHRFHDRVADVFASLGPGLTRGGASASGSGAPAPPPAWMPANTSVWRRGRDVREGSDDASDSDSDDASAANRAPDADEVGARRRKREESRDRYPDDLDCLASDEDDDETRRGVALGRSVGRCAALDAEDEYDYYDEVAAASSDGGPPGKTSATAGSGDGAGAGPRREARATRVPPAKRARGIAWDGSVRDERRRPRGNATAGARTSDLPSRRRGNSWVPDHVRNPHKYDCYALDEPLIIGGGSRGDAGSVPTPGLAGVAGRDARGKERSRNAARGGGARGGDEGGADAAAEDDDAQRAQTRMPAPTFGASSTGAAAARDAARRRRDARRPGVAANGAVAEGLAKAARNGNILVSFDAACDDEAEDGGGGDGGDGGTGAGFTRGSARRPRSLRKRGA